ncbi:aldo/keto reductase [uncultured Roseovarius sp.]|uniref:aldo/keto reductase n=1 Tax=uncultured Roseovarius sp. TaxID=293344 RepID=UPI00261E7CFE|nr:aldo/keto reductase [uncultured Roseovarius sp.]
MKFLDTDISPLGMGCWPIGGAMFSGDQPLGYTNVDDDESIPTIHAALDAGITLFDTAPAYGAGHAERILCRALKKRPEALIATKFGTGIIEESKQITENEDDPASVLPAIERSLTRLGRDRIDVLILHLNSLPVPKAEALFDEVEKACAAGKVRSYGWSTDFSESAVAFADRPAFVAVEYAMNVLLDAPRMRRALRENNLIALIRSPLAMGLLGGNYGVGDVMRKDDIRATSNPRTDYFADGKVNPAYFAKLDTIRALLRTGGRTLAQGAIGWLWAQDGANIPIPGARTVEQIEGLAGALAFGALPDDVVAQIEALIEREPDDTPDRVR